MNISAVFPSLPRHIALPLTETAQISKDFSFLIPTISVLALGTIYASNIPVGMAVGLGTFALSTMTMLALQALNLLKEDPDNAYENELNKNPLLATLVAPFLEEGLFRGMLQPWVADLMISFFPAVACAFLGTSLSVATTVAIVVSAVFFGLIHAFNRHENARIQAAIAVVGGIILGTTAAHYGLAAAIAAHIVNNTLAMVALKLRNESPTSTSEAGSEFAAVRV